MHDKEEFEVIVLQLLDVIIRRLDKMALDFTALTADVAAEVAADQAAIVLINGIAAEIAAAVAAATMDPTDQATIAGLATQLQASASALGAAVVANTPVAANTAPVSNTVANTAPAANTVANTAPVANVAPVANT